MGIKYYAPRGTHDFLPKESIKRRQVETIAADLFTRWGYNEISTPVFEDLTLFTRSIGETTDIVEKEMYTFTDKKGRSFALRPEGTAPVVRAVIENSLLIPGNILKLFYTGKMYRYERPQAGRYREFMQIGVEFFGSGGIYADFEILDLAGTLLTELGVKQYELHLNTLGCPECRPKYRDAILSFLTQIKPSLCDDCQRRIATNPFRVLDCKIDKTKIHEIPKVNGFLCPTCTQHHTGLTALLQENDISYQSNPYLVRGLDYYTRSVFEITTSELGSQDTILAGGRYDNLVTELGGPSTPAIGFALGVDRILPLIPNEIISKSVPNYRIFFIALGESARTRAVPIVRSLRQAKYNVELGFYDTRSLKSQLRTADATGIRYVLILGDDELNTGQIILRDLRQQTQIMIPISELLPKLNELNLNIDNL